MEEFRRKAERTFVVQLLDRKKQWGDGDAHPNSRVEDVKDAGDAVIAVLRSPGWLPMKRLEELPIGTIGEVNVRANVLDCYGKTQRWRVKVARGSDGSIRYIAAPR